MFDTDTIPHAGQYEGRRQPFGLPARARALAMDDSDLDAAALPVEDVDRHFTGISDISRAANR